ncbi:MAG: AAA family ATPase [Myxococcota bacterium]|nr:AAA family ATPase [Myxococcota bacterium]
MYLDFYGMAQAPFEMTPDPSFLYLGEVHREGLATLVYAMQSGTGFVVLTGEVGTGKTTLLNALLSQLDPDTASAYLFNPKLEPLDFFKMLFEEFGIGDACTTKADYLLALNRFLIERHEKGQSALLIVDEAQNLSPEVLEEIRLLSNLETATSKLIQIMLVGQPELGDLLARPELRQIRQRVSLRHDLRSFDEAETGEYIDERLSRAGHTGPRIFKRSARRVIFKRTGGIPRLINALCDSALLLGYSRDVATLDAALVSEAADDLVLGMGGETIQPSQRRKPRRRWFGLRR